jgi:CheY-like chemotaxis protein
VAHDFNNLLTAIICCSELLAERLPEDETTREYLNEILKAGERGTALVRQLMAFSRSQVLHPVVLDLNAVVRDIENMLRTLIGEDVHLVTALEDQLACIKADRSHIEMAIMNLAVNARDAMPEGGTVTLASRSVRITEDAKHGYRDGRPGHYVELAVTDTGHGMDEETRAHCFEPFFTTKEPGQGTGLGLSTVYGIVKQSGGDIRVDSAAGDGSTFRIAFPAVPDESRLATRQPVAPEALRGSETILIVEDEAAVRQLGAAILLNQGYTVLEAASPGDALLVCQQRQQPIHLLLTDIVMPLMNGFELAKRLATIHPEMRTLFMSAYAATVLSRYRPESGPAEPPEVLQKPFSRQSLVRRVREVLNAPRPPA